MIQIPCTVPINQRHMRLWNSLTTTKKFKSQPYQCVTLAVCFLNLEVARAKQMQQLSRGTTHSRTKFSRIKCTWASKPSETFTIQYNKSTTLPCQCPTLPKSYNRTTKPQCSHCQEFNCLPALCCNDERLGFDMLWSKISTLYMLLIDVKSHWHWWYIHEIQLIVFCSVGRRGEKYRIE